MLASGFVFSYKIILSINLSLVMEYKSYTTIHPKSVEQQEKESKIAQSVENHPRGKQFYVGNLTWVCIGI